MESMVTEISCSLHLNHPHTTATTNPSISLLSSPHVIPSSNSKPAATTTTASLLNVDNSKSTAPPLLPLPPSRPLFPSPLKFLWFGRDNPPNSPPITSDPPPLPLKVAKFGPEDPAPIAPQPCTCFLDSDSHASNADRFAINDVECSEETNEVSGQLATADSSPQLNRPDERSRLISTSSSDSERNWISRILQFRLLWNVRNPELERSRELVKSTLIIAAKGPDRALVGNSGLDDVVDDCVQDGNCGLSNHEDEQGLCMLEESRERVVHDQQSVSMFLHEVPVAEVQAISKLCVLSNLAYIVPEVQSKDLLKEHHLSFVTSSLIKKEEAEVKATLEKSLTHATKQKNIGGKKNPKTREENAVLVKALCGDGSLDNGLSSSQNLLFAEAGTLDIKVPQVQDVNADNDERTSLEETMDKAGKEEALKVQGNCPCEWFICDDEASSTRYLVIQGSESLASWQTNLSFDPTKFEDLGVLVHRGVYEAAQGLYKMVEEEIVEHTRKGSHARVCFTGHSLGGSLATVLAMMVVRRGLVRASAVAGVVTLGAASVMCGGEALLPQLGLQAKQFVNVVMHRDIVPRAFSCDYPHHVARLLKRVNGSFRDHPCLHYQRLLYAPVGQVMILQPDNEQSPSHPLLPSKIAGLYLIKHPQEDEQDTKIMSTISQVALEVGDVQRAFFNMPHPLDMLRDPGAYGFEGAISRDHDPRSYRRAINAVISHGLRRVRCLRTQQRKTKVKDNIYLQLPSLGSPLTPPSSPLPALSPIMLPHLGPSSSSLSPLKKHVLHHSSRLLASKHIHMGVLFILSMTTSLLSSLSWV